MRVEINIMRAERGDPVVWKEVYEQGKQIAAEFDIEPSMPKTTRRQLHRANVPVTTQSPTDKELCISLLLII